MNNSYQKESLRFFFYLKREDVVDFVTSLESDVEVINLEKGEGGLYMLKMRDGVMNDEFYLGEISAARSAVRVREISGGFVGEGGAVIMKDDKELVTMIAICDALYSVDSSYYQRIKNLEIKGKAIIDARNTERASIRSRTKVDFSLLEEASNE